MILKKSIVTLVVLILSTACAQKSIRESVKSPGTAVVIIGIFGIVSWQKIYSNDPKNKSHIYSDAQYNDAVLMPVTVGANFRVTEVDRSKSGRSMSVEFSRSPLLKIDKKGIYYYGVILTEAQGGQIASRISSQFDPRAIEIVKRKYPAVFRDLPKINFD